MATGLQIGDRIKVVKPTLTTEDRYGECGTITHIEDSGVAGAEFLLHIVFDNPRLGKYELYFSDEVQLLTPLDLLAEI